ncbi:MAG: hypothetical protein CL565_01320 [Alphaproteobacteria bacterium]|nr:hypothetical protein [Alphaproteobacteria bacterium]
MLKALWTLAKALTVLVLFLFLANQEGDVNVNWGEYTLEADLGLFLVAVLFFVLAALVFQSFFNLLFDAPTRLKRFWRERSTKKAMSAMTRSLVLLSAGDYKHAAYMSYRAQKLLPSDYDSSTAAFIEAQAAQRLGQDERTSQKYKDLLENRDAAFLGIRGKMQSELEAGHYEDALRMAYSADEMHPKQPWILKTVYDLETRNRSWEKAYSRIPQLKKLKVLTPAQADRDAKALLVALADMESEKDNENQAISNLKKALKVDAGFTPAVSRLISYELKHGHKRRAKKLIENAWKLTPHPDLVKFWDRLAPENSARKTTARLKWYENLVAHNPKAVDGQLAAAQVAIDDGLWNEARAYLSMAEKLEPSRRVYRLWAELEELSTRNDEAVQAWLRQAANAQPSKKWLCMLTHRTYNDWHILASPHNSFNTIIWDYPNRDILTDHVIEQSKKEGPQDPLLNSF